VFPQLESALRRAVGDADIIRRYDEKKSQLDHADLQLQLAKGRLDTLQGDIGRLQEEWYSGVKTMVDTIDKHFGRYFERIGCRGRVQLQQEGAKYGIVISVSFRKDAVLQSLSGTSQSGGEKSVSTMLYLLCLQEVTNTPFRMVDEINQGMDANNERLIFNQIVRSCEETRDDANGQRIEPPQVSAPSHTRIDRSQDRTPLNAPIHSSVCVPAVCVACRILSVFRRDPEAASQPSLLRPRDRVQRVQRSADAAADGLGPRQIPAHRTIGRATGGAGEKETKNRHGGTGRPHAQHRNATGRIGIATSISKQPTNR